MIFLQMSDCRPLRSFGPDSVRSYDPPEAQDPARGDVSAMGDGHFAGHRHDVRTCLVVSAIDTVVPMGIACEASVKGMSSINAVTETMRKVCARTLIQRYCLTSGNSAPQRSGTSDRLTYVSVARTDRR